MPVTLDEFTRAVDPASLPKVLQVQTGIYPQESVYEMFGKTCCLSTGDLLKVIDISITQFVAHSSDNTELHLSLDNPGLFRVVADKQPYNSIQEIVDSAKVMPHRPGQPTYRSTLDLQLSAETLRAGESFRVTEVRTGGNGSVLVDCESQRKDGKHNFSLNPHQEGPFLECEDDQFYTLRELAEWKIPKGRKRTVTMATTPPWKDRHRGELTLSPVYDLRVIMRYRMCNEVREEMVLIPSNLDVEVEDVTNEFDSNTFAKPLSLRDIFQRPPETLPMLAEVMGRPYPPQSQLLPLLRSQRLIVHRAFRGDRVLVSETRCHGSRHFLLPPSYNGKFKRQPRQFATAYDLEMARSEKEQLHVVATRAYESQGEGQISVLVGDQFLLRRRKAGGGSAVAEGTGVTCAKIVGKRFEPVLLHVGTDGGFMEVVHDKRQYTLSEICRGFPLPFNVKVSVRDLSINEDILAALPGLQVEEEVTDPYLLISTPDLQEYQEVPVSRTALVLKEVERWTGKECSITGNSIVEEISDDCYYTLRRYITTSTQPPPRPPKAPRQAPKRPPKPQSPRTEKPNPTSPHDTPKSLCVDRVQPVRESVSDISNSTEGGERKGPTNLASPSGTTPPIAGLADMGDEEDNEDHDYEYIDEEEFHVIS